MDLTALDVSHPVMESIYRQYYDEPRYRPSVITAQRLAGGVVGRKAGEGFYRYVDGKAQVRPSRRCRKSPRCRRCGCRPRGAPLRAVPAAQGPGREDRNRRSRPRRRR